MVLYLTENEGGPAARITFCDDSTDGTEAHRFEAWVEGNHAYVEYQETQTWRGQIRVSDPPEKVYRRVIQSDLVTEFLDKHGATKTTRLRPK
jgi:hypothetical protein